MASETQPTESEPRKPTFTPEEEKEIFSHPFFAKTAEDMEGHPAYEALRALKYESEDPDANAEAYKEEGNYYVKQKEYEKAVLAYTGGINAEPIDKKLLAVLYTNRGIANGLWSKSFISVTSTYFYILLYHFLSILKQKALRLICILILTVCFIVIKMWHLSFPVSICKFLFFFQFITSSKASIHVFL